VTTAIFILTPCFSQTFSNAFPQAKGFIPPALLITLIPYNWKKKNSNAFTVINLKNKE